MPKRPKQNAPASFALNFRLLYHEKEKDPLWFLAVSATE